MKKRNPGTGNPVFRVRWSPYLTILNTGAAEIGAVGYAFAIAKARNRTKQKTLANVCELTRVAIWLTIFIERGPERDHDSTPRTHASPAKDRVGFSFITSTGSA